ncbi:hypothetical protein GCM10009641_84880 [Mycobacterium cookii]|uniref:Uncharacterized protein n=2 Tax=Nocardioides furvisabuli TaxID=375542 RepID=A0ABN2WXR7_9ACTN
MGLSDVLARSASRHAHALVVEVPGSWRARMTAERNLFARGWRLADSPADADVLVVCGAPGPGLAEAIESVWHQMPGPRVRVDVHAGDEVGARLDEAHRGLLDTDHHRRDAQQRPTASELLAEQAEPEAESHGGHEGMDHGGHDGMDHGGHEGHDDMEMSPGGIPLAEGGEDRDGLEMDVLQVRFGPVLPHWPAGLVLRCSLQGDVIVEAQAELVDGAARQEDDVIGPARGIDNIASLLALTGWDDAAAEARRIRDTALEPGDGAAGSDLERLRRRVRRSWTLRWSLRGVRRLSDEGAHARGLPADAVGDTYDRLIGMLDRAVAGVAATAAGDTGRTNVADRTLSTDHLAPLVTGLDLATARLVLASLDVHELVAGQAEHEVSHG